MVQLLGVKQDVLLSRESMARKEKEGGRVSPGWFSLYVSAGPDRGGHVLRLELYQGDLLAAEALVTNPLCVDLLSEEMEGSLDQTCADAVKPEVAARLAQDRLVIVMNFFVADSTRINWWSIGVLWVEHHRLVGWIDLLRGHGQGTRTSHTRVARTGSTNSWMAWTWSAHSRVPRTRASHSWMTWTWSTHAWMSGTWSPWPHSWTLSSHARM